MKISLIGAGSWKFASHLIGDITTYPEILDGLTISLMDINEEKLNVSRRLALTIAEQQSVNITVEATTDCIQSIKDADYVICMIFVGGNDVYEIDKDIPRRYGIIQPIGDTVGPGGIFRALRTIPVLLDICHNMEKVCPGALFINYANPMAMNTWALNDATSVRVVGLCHNVQGTAAELADYFGVPTEELVYWAAGINHMSWFLELKWKGKDMYPLLKEKMADPEIFKTNTVRFDLLRRFGYFPSESSTHHSEYYSYYLKDAETIKQFYIKELTVQEEREGYQRHYADIIRKLDKKERIEINRSVEYASYIIHSETTNTPRRCHVNVRNTRLITNLPQDCIVEVPALVDGHGISPCYIGELSPGIISCLGALINEQRLAVKAALTGNKEYVYQALMSDPLTSAILNTDKICKMANELFEANVEYLPQFR